MKQSPPLAVEMWPIDRPVPYAGNPRRITDRAVDKTAASLKEFGWRHAIVVDKDGIVVAGHTRLLAAKKLGMTEVPVHVAADLTPAQVKAFRLADNRTGEEAKWDLGLLPIEIGSLVEMGFDLRPLGFDGRELDAFGALGTKGKTDPDAVPPLPETPVTKPGDLWILGPHRVLCGDATSAADVGRLLAGAQPHLMVTDPPYGVKYDPDWRNRVDLANGKPSGARAVGTVSNDDDSDWREAWALFPGDVAYVWHASGYAITVHQSLDACGLQFRSQIIWRKPRFVISRGDYHWAHECCFYVVRKGRTAHWQGSRHETTVWDIDHMKSETGHGTQKPVEAMRRPIVNNSEAGDSVYDPFLGSGTTLIAAEQTGRICFGMDIDPAYVDVTVKRWEAFTGGTARCVRADDARAAPVPHAEPSARRRRKKAAETEAPAA